MDLLLPRLSKSSGSSVRINVWRQRRASVAPIGRVFPKSPDLTKRPDETLDLTAIGLSNKNSLLFPVVGNDRISSSPMDYKKIDDDDNSTEAYCTAPNLPELPGLPGERRGLKTPTEPPVFCLKGEGQRLPTYVIGTTKIENSPGGMVLKSICTQLHTWFETLSGQNVDETSIKEELKRLLYIKKMRVYLEVRKKIFTPEVHCVPIFHCPCCLEHWTVTGWAPQDCPNSIQPTRGPEVVMYGTKMRFISMHPKGKTNILDRRQECSKRKIGIPVGISRPPYPSIPTNKREYTPSEPHSSLSNPSRVSNEREENKDPASDLTTICASPAQKMYVKHTFPELDLKNDRQEEEKSTVDGCADEPDGVPQSRASMSLIQSISMNDDHYNEYARSSSRIGRRRNTYGGHLYSDDPKTLWKTYKLTSSVPLTLLGDEDRLKMSHENFAITPVSSNDSIIRIEGKDCQVAEKVEATTQKRYHTSQSESNIDASPEDKADIFQPVIEGLHNTSSEAPQPEDQELECERNHTEKVFKKTEVLREKQMIGLSSLDKNDKTPSIGEKKDKEMVSLLRNSALKKIDPIETKHAKQEKITVTWSDKKVLPKLSGDSNKELDQDGKKTISMEAPNSLPANAASEGKASNEENDKRSLPPTTAHFKEASKSRHMEEQIPKPEDQVIKRYLEKSKPKEPQIADCSQRMVESSSAQPLSSRTDRVRSSRGVSTSADNKKIHHPISSEKESLTIEGAQEGFALPHRRRTEILHKKERKTTIKRPKHAFHSKEMENVKAETLPVTPQEFNKPHVLETTALYASGCLTDTHKSTLITNKSGIFSTAVLPSEHAQDLAGKEINDEFRSVVADIRNDIKIADLERRPSRLTHMVKKGSKIDANVDEDDDDDELFEEIDSKTELFSKRIPSAIHRLPVSNAFTFSFYELPSQYEKRNRKLRMASLKIGHGRRKQTV